MELRFYKAGGIRGRLPQKPLTITQSDLSRGEEESLNTLIADAKKTTCTIAPTDARPDRIYYRIELDDQDGATVWDVAEANIPDDVRPLLQWLRQKDK